MPLLASTTTLTSNLNPSNFEDEVDLSISVSDPSLVGTPSGDVVLSDSRDSAHGGFDPVTTALDGGGNATLSTNELFPGIHVITAVYQGDGFYSTSSSGPVTQQVNSINITTILPSFALIAIVTP